MAKNKDLTKARNNKKDEFYTTLTDIEKELRYYKKHFAGKTVFCNCDDPFESNFFKYFTLNFNRLKLKKLICTCYAGSPVSGQQLSLFDVIDGPENKNKSYKAIINVVYDKDGDGGVDMFDVAELFKSGENELTELNEDGDFRSEECMELLRKSDIVVTNPPFSLFRPYVSTLIDNNKKFIIIGNLNATTYMEIFPLLMNNQMWIGPSIHSGDRKFYVPDDYPLNASGCGIDEDGRKYIRVKGVRWYTNLDIKQRHDEIILVRRYEPEEYPMYENLAGCINVNRVSEIPCDYDGPMGVPITFLDKYCPEQFEILGCADANILPEGWKGAPKHFIKLYYEQGNTGQYQEGNRLACYITKEGIAKIPYKRVIVRNKYPEKPKEK